MTQAIGTKVVALCKKGKDDRRDGLVQIRKRDLERLTTEVMQLREFLPKVVNGDLIEILQKARAAETMKEHLGQEQEQLRQECLHLRSRLDAAQSECQKEREEKLVLREQLWESREQLQQQAEFCTGLGAASCTLLWSTSSKEEAVKDILADGKLQSFLSVAGQTLESFVKSLDGEAKAEQQDSNSHEQQFVLALAGVVTNVAAVTCGRDYLSSSAQVLLETLMQLLELLKPGVFPKLKVLMLMALYNVSISVKGLKYIREFPGLFSLIWTLLEAHNGDNLPRVQCVSDRQSLNQRSECHEFKKFLQRKSHSIHNFDKPVVIKDDRRDGLVQIRKRDLERLTTEVMQLREFLPKVVNGDLIEILQKARAAETMKEHLGQEQEQLRQECLHLRSRLDAAQSECQKEREEKLVLREQLWESREQLQQQAEFCTGLGAASCTLLWSTSSKEEAVKDILADGKLQSFLSVAGQTLESFVKSLDGEAKAEQQDSNSHEQQFVLALAGVVTNVAAVTCGRDYLSSSAQVLLETLMQLLELLKPGVFPKLKVLMLMALYNVSISVKGLKYIREFPGLFSLIWTLLEDGDSEVCLHALRLLQSVLLEEAVALVGPGLPLDDPLLPLERIRTLATSSRHPALRQTAQETLDDLGSLRASFLDPHDTSSSDQVHV